MLELLRLYLHPEPSRLSKRQGYQGRTFVQTFGKTLPQPPSFAMSSSLSFLRALAPTVPPRAAGGFFMSRP